MRKKPLWSNNFPQSPPLGSNFQHMGFWGTITKTITATVESTVIFPQKVKHGVIMWSSNSLHRYIPQRIGKKSTWTYTYIPMFVEALVTIAKMQKLAMCPSMDEWINKLWYTYTMEYYSALIRQWHMLIHASYKHWYMIQHGSTLETLLWVKA